MNKAVNYRASELEDGRFIQAAIDNGIRLKTQELKENITVKIGEASTLFVSEDGQRLDGVFDEQRAMRIVKEIMQLIADHDTQLYEATAEAIREEQTYLLSPSSDEKLIMLESTLDHIKTVMKGEE